MTKEYLGHLPETDPLFHYLKNEIFAVYYNDSPPLAFRVFRTHASNDVFLYEETGSGIRLIGKFFLSAKMTEPGTAEARMEREYRNLLKFRSLGLDHPPHYVARPLGRKRELNCLLLEEFCPGISLDRVIRDAIFLRHGALLYTKLSALASFLAALHNRSAATGERVDFRECRDYGEVLLRVLHEQNLCDSARCRAIQGFFDEWSRKACMHADCPVLVHGDATPSNFIFGKDSSVITFDLERVRRTDRVFDVGRIAGEIFHFFLLNTGDKYAAETYLSHFFREYASYFPDRTAAFHSITSRNPYYMGITLLRIARNDYLQWDYRKRLLTEAECCLRPKE